MKTKSRGRLRALTRFPRCVAACLTAALIAAPVARAQETGDVDSLARQAIAVNSTIRSAAARVTAARERVSPAGVWPDPMLMLGIINVPLGSEELPAHGAPMGPDPMTMRVIGIEQTVPFPGKLSMAALRWPDPATSGRVAPGSRVVMSHWITWRTARASRHVPAERRGGYPRSS
ncbi:MAG: hypothetical protein ABIV11_11290, partial [Gemmatimonadaceae bacterium]